MNWCAMSAARAAPPTCCAMPEALPSSGQPSGPPPVCQAVDSVAGPGPGPDDGKVLGHLTADGRPTDHRARDAGTASVPLTPPPATRLAPGAVRRWLMLGVRDFLAMPLPSLAYGLAFVAMAFVLERFLRDGAWMLAFVTGFALVAPFLAIGLYSLARDRSRGDAPAFTRSLVAWRSNFGQVAIYGAILTLLFAAWIRVSVVIVALFFDQPAATLDALLAGLAADPEGWVFVTVYGLAGAGFAWLVFATSVAAVPMMLDRQVDVLSAMIWSFQAALANLPAMAGWALAIALLIGLGMLARFVPLAVIVPVIGYASWHVFRELAGSR